ncbi:MAG: glycosyltransferase family 2 protein, partial [Sinobacteraceae bacterium]|nr:glycosyltransferase family 2 protein [Nevskiaceae bacterium]
MSANSVDKPYEPAHICAVVVTYHPLARYADNILALAQQVGKVLVVDNGSDEDSLAAIRHALARIDGVLMSMGGNVGIGAALNAGLRFAQQQGFAWLATFDQDSRVTEGMIATMLSTLDEYAYRERVAIVTPRHLEQGLRKIIQDRASAGAGHGWRLLITTLTSGNLVRIQPALAAGGFDEGLFIDYVDHEFCLRLRRSGQQVLEASNATLLHSLGRMQWRKILGLRIAVVNQPSTRRYYISRNRVIVWRNYWRSVPFWVM